MPKIALPPKRDLAGRFNHSRNLAVHNLEPGNSMLVSYPGSPYGAAVFLLGNISVGKDVATGFFVNGGPCYSLAALAAGSFKMDIGKERDHPIYYGGEANMEQLFILTPHDWEPSIEGSYATGPYRVHTSPTALVAILDGGGPEKMRLLKGNVVSSFTGLCKEIHQNELGEIITDDEILFGNAHGMDKWKRALDIHTGGNLLCLPQPSVRGDLTLRDGQTPPPPKLYMN